MAKILLVEDDQNLSEIYQARLSSEGYEIVSASNGEDALAVASKEKPDLVISDVMMPRVSGFEMLDILRHTDGMQAVKTIMLTALGQDNDRSKASELGADRYLVKSQVTLEDIVTAVKELLGDAPAPAAAAGPVTPTPSTPSEPVAAADQTTLEPTPAPAAAPTEPTVTAPAEPPVAAPTPPAPDSLASTTTTDQSAVTPTLATDSTGDAASPTTTPPASEPSSSPAQATSGNSQIDAEEAELAKSLNLGGDSAPAISAPASSSTESAPTTAAPQTADSATRPPAPEAEATEKTPEASEREAVLANALKQLENESQASSPPSEPEASTTETEETKTGGQNISGHKMIQPPSEDSAPKPDINQLLAQEEADGMTSTDGQANTEPNPDDPNSIAL